MCRVIMERIRITSDPLEGEEELPAPKVRRMGLSDGVGDDGDKATAAAGAARMDADGRRRNRVLGIGGRDSLVKRQERCVVCLEDVSWGHTNRMDG